MTKSIRLCIAKDANFGSYGNVVGWHLFIEKNNRGRTIKKQRCVKATDDQIVFDCDIDDFITSLEVIADD